MTFTCEEQTPDNASAVWRRSAESFAQKADSALADCRDPRQLKSLARETGHYLDEAVSRGALDLKLRLIHLRENLLDRMLDQL